MKKFLTLVFAIVTFNITFSFAQLATNSQIISENFSNGFSSWTPAAGNTGTAVIDAMSGSPAPAIKIEKTATSGSFFMSKMLNINDIKGATLNLTANIKAINISTPPNTWNGLKIQLVINTPSGIQYPQVNLPASDTYNWEQRGINIFIPNDATSAQLNIGLELVSGILWLDNILLKVKRSSLDYPAASPANTVINKFHSEDMWRGFMVGRPNQSDVALLKTWNTKMVRWQLGDFDQSNTFTLANTDYDSKLNTQLAYLDAALPHFKQQNIKVVVCLMSLSHGCLFSKANQDKFDEVWKKIAIKYKNEPIIWAYDLANEPLGDFKDGTWKSDVLLWEDLAERTAKTIRTIDANRSIVVESHYGSPKEFEKLKPINVSNIIYSTHFYEPLKYTHQGIGNTNKSSYPGVTENVYWDKTKLKESLKYVKAFQDKYKVPIYVGEFSAIRWADGAATYLKDAIGIFEEYNWDWNYHAFREATYWNLEHANTAPENTGTTTTTDRLQVILNGLAKITTTTCAAPILQGTASGTTANLNWVAVSGAISHTTEWKLSTATTWANQANTVSPIATLANMPAGSTLDFRVKTICSSNSSSPYSNIVTLAFNPAACQAPNLQGTVNGRTVNLTWAAVSGAVSYVVEWKTSANTTWANQANTVNPIATLANMPAYTNMNFRVKTVCSGNVSSSYSNVITIMTAATTSDKAADSDESNNIFVQNKQNKRFFNPNTLNVVPNPIQDNIFLYFNFEEKSNVVINIFDVSGKLIINENLENIEKGRYEINATNLPNGVYFMSALVNNKEMITRKIVK